ncbi:MAG TPA: biotin--[acetyl-CoA-carboxylase] ligase [Chthoniobacterales bacterium]|nr:biotin--[acetyl-CoA-carboxylase] ligase [Chthoniobacterales bacterium]
MSGTSDRLIASELRAGLEGYRIGNEIVVLEETESTNDVAWQSAERGAAAGFVVFAERQTKGRGQYGRRWQSAPYLGLWFSILLRPAMTLLESPKLTPLLAEVIAEAIRDETGCATTIKPPNDIYVSGRKVAGVLVEGRTANDGSYVAVAGIGINVNQALDDFPEELRESAGSLAMATGKNLSRPKLAIALLQRLAAHPGSGGLQSAV